ncbi:MAG: hypothetical protein ACLRWH_09335, partial [Emergencia sp.]
LNALREVAASYVLQKTQPASLADLTVRKLEQQPLPTMTERIPIEEAAGRVCASAIIPYPPGIPIVCPGEVIDREILEYVMALRKKGEKVIGIDDCGRIVVGKEKILISGRKRSKR